MFYQKLHSVKLALAAGILWGLALFLMTLISAYTGWAMFWLSQWMDLYPGFNLSIKGAFFGLLYGFIDGFICLFLLSWLYNVFLGTKKNHRLEKDDGRQRTNEPIL